MWCVSCTVGSYVQLAANFKWDLRGSPYKSIAANYASTDFLLHVITNSIGINSKSKVQAHLAAIGIMV